MRLLFVLALSLFALVLVGASGCSSSGARARSDAMGSPSPARSTADARHGTSLPRARPAPLRTQRVGADLMAGAFVPYDNMSLPLVSPDGRFLATQTRIGPDWPTILAEHGAEVPYATHIEIYELPRSVQSDGRPQAGFIAEVDVPALLGRSYDEHGFLIESPQEDGSRWIGYASWENGEVTWLVADEHVNAFAALGPDGRLAWSRRAVDAADDALFELVVRSGNDEWILGSNGFRAESWLMPTWSWRGDGLFVFTLSQGQLSAVFAPATDAESFRRSRQRIGLAIEADVLSAHQAIGAQTCGPGSTGLDPRTSEALLFVHPSQMRMALWRPAGRGGAQLLDRGSYAAVMHDAEYAIVSTEETLLLSRVDDERDRAQMIVGVNVARPTPMSSEWPYVLLAPEVDGQVGVIPMRPLGPRDLAGR